jgi:hypothetical protein
MGHQGESDVEHEVWAKGLVRSCVSVSRWMLHRLSGLTSVAGTRGRQFMSHEHGPDLQTPSGVVPMIDDPYRVGSTAVPNDAKWRLEYPRHPDECIAALEVARRIGVRSWTVVAEILRNQPAKRTHTYWDRVHEAADALGIEFWDEARPSGEPRRHFKLPR